MDRTTLALINAISREIDDVVAKRLGGADHTWFDVEHDRAVAAFGTWLVRKWKESEEEER